MYCSAGAVTKRVRSHMTDKMYSLMKLPRTILGYCYATFPFVVVLVCTHSAWGGADERLDISAKKPGHATLISLQGEITDVMVDSLRRRINEAQQNGASTIIFDMDTPGGLVSSSIAIGDMIRNLTDIKTVAWVNPNAHSGGSIVAVACDEIVMARSSRMGDSQVVTVGGAIPKDMQAKAYTPVLADFRASARLNGYSQVLSEAFVLPDREVWWIEHKLTGDRKFVFAEDKIKLVGGEASPRSTKTDDDSDGDEDDAGKGKDKPKPATTPKPPSSPDDYGWQLVETYYDAVMETDVDTIQPVVRNDQLLEMAAGEAQAYGFSKGVVANEKELRARYGITDLSRLAPSWSEALAYWLTSMYVRGFLMVIIMLGAYVEFHTPGVGVPGLVALICLGVFVGAPYAAGLANIWEIIFIGAGIILMALEIFVIPGFGVAGILGVFMLIAGLLFTFVPDEPGRLIPLYIPELPSTMKWLSRGIITMVTSMIASLIGMVILQKYLPRMPLFNRLIPNNPMPSEVQVQDAYRGAARVGDIGMAESPLRPAGKARFGGMVVDVVAQGEFVESNTKVQVIERRGNHVVVQPIDDSQA